MFGNNVSKALNRTRRRFDANIIRKRFFVPEEDKWVTLNVSTAVLKTINKKGITAVLKEAKKKGNYKGLDLWLKKGIGYRLF